MAGPITVDDGVMIEKVQAALQVYRFTWGSRHLSATATIAQSTWTIAAIEPPNDVSLVSDQAAIESGDQTTRVRLSGGRLGGIYKVTNTIVTNETPAQTLLAHVIVKIT